MFAGRAAGGALGDRDARNIPRTNRPSQAAIKQLGIFGNVR
jgi:hypothetical protein